MSWEIVIQNVNIPTPTAGYWCMCVAVFYSLLQLAHSTMW